MADDRNERIARNESTFRSLNETLDEGLRKVTSIHGETAAFVCECGDLDCTKIVYASLDRYEDVRSEPRRFLIVPGHEIAHVEDVIEQGQRYAIVQKHEDVRDVVEALDPRSP